MSDEEVKAKYGEVDKIEVIVSEEDTAVMYFRKASRYIISAIVAKVATDLALACELWIDSCLITEISDQRVKTDDSIFFSVANEMNEIVSLKKSKLTRL